MVTEKKKWIKTADFEAKTRELVKGYQRNKSHHQIRHFKSSGRLYEIVSGNRRTHF